jgi:hypothetical protein
MAALIVWNSGYQGSEVSSFQKINVAPATVGKLVNAAIGCMERIS